MASSSPPRYIPPSTHGLADESPPDVESHSPNTQPLGIIFADTPNPRTTLRKPSFQRSSPVIPITRTFTEGSRATRAGDDVVLSPASGKPPIPSALPAGGDEAAYSTPLPVVPMIVLSITMLSEFLTASVCTPFLLFMVEGFLVNEPEADIGFWTGILVSTFFLTQFFTSLLWATVAERHGSRIVLFVSLLGSALTCVAFGTSTSFPEALVIRLMQGIFAGSIGVARSSVANITDGSNEGRAYAILGFCWGLGGVVGAIVGGTFESPAKKWPNVFAKVPFFVRFPYVLPCIIAASITFTGAVLSVFLSRDGGTREGAIRLPIVKEEGEEAIDETANGADLISDDDTSPPSKDVVSTLRKKLSKRFSAIFARRVLDAHGELSSSDPVPLSSSVPIPRRTSRAGSTRTSRANGSAYGYGGYRTANAAMSLRRGSVTSTLRRRRGTFGDGSAGTDGVGTPRESNFAQRLLMANEMAVTNIADLWVAAAMNVDNEEVFMSDDEDLDVDEFAMDEDVAEEGARYGTEFHRTPTSSSAPQARNPLELRRTATGENAAPRLSVDMRRTMTLDTATPRGSRDTNRTVTAATRIPSGTRSPAFRRGSGQYSTPTRSRFAALAPSLRDSPREEGQLRLRTSRSFSFGSSQLPSIYANAGVRAPPGVMLSPLITTPGAAVEEDPFNDGLGTIPEGRGATRPQEAHLPEQEEQQTTQSVFKQLPLMIIMQYGLLALHSTTHDQIFLSYLVSKYEAGGLGLNAAHFAQLIALMCLAQIAYQFYLYPNIGPPRGRFSHLAMFRIGSLLFIPGYITVTLYRVFASKTDDGNFILMTLLAISMALRYCGSTFSYTAVSILLNYMSPPHVVGLANGLAQSIVSLARFAGPVLGGYLWSMSVENNPGGYPLGFFICSGVCALAILHSFFIR